MKKDLPERTFKLATRIVELCCFLEQKPGTSRTLANQLLRSGASVGANVEEGQAAQSEADFLTKYSIACKEARETHYWLRLLAVTKIVPENRLVDLLEESNQIITILTSIIKKLKEKRDKK
jgi:four helix bundle protein